MISNKAANRYKQQAIPTHAKQWLSKQRYIAIQGLLGGWGSWLFGFDERHNILVVGSSNRSRLQLGKQAESYNLVPTKPTG